MTLDFDEGIIGRWSAFLKKRFGAGPMLGKAVGTSIVSSSLDKVELIDLYGTLKPNLFFIDIAPSGIGIKTPILVKVRKTIERFDPLVLGPSRFTPESIPKYVKGKLVGEEDGDASEKKGASRIYIPRDHFIIVKDEISRMLADRKHHTYMDGSDEVLSDMWDGYIQGNYTNKRGLEGNTPCYVSLYGAGSYRFLQLLDDTFFIQGTGNRILWIDEPVYPPKIDENFFLASDDEELEELIDWTVDGLKKIREKPRKAVIGEFTTWRDWANEQIDKSVKAQKENFIGTSDTEPEAEYKSKMLMNTLKLAMNYAASQFSFDREGQLAVSSGNLDMALADGKEYIRMWGSLMRKASLLHDEMKNTEFRIQTRKIDLIRVLNVASKTALISQSSALAKLDATDKKAMHDVIELGVEKGFLRRMTGRSDLGDVTRGSLTQKVFDEFKPKTGPRAQLYEITAAGKKHLESPPVE